MLKNAASGVLASFRPSTYLRGYVEGLNPLRPCWTAFLNILQRITSFDVPVSGTHSIVPLSAFSLPCFFLLSIRLV